jgi:formylglycine-generating enzyme required for sulfatase activity
MAPFIQSLPGSNIRFTMVPIDGGEFDMGGKSWNEDSLPVHRVALSDFLMAAHPVKQDLWEAVLGKEKNESPTRHNLPIAHRSSVGGCVTGRQSPLP